MKKGMKKLCIFLLLAAFLVGLTACGGTAEETAAPAESEAPAATEAPAAETAAPETAESEAPEAAAGISYPLVEETVTLTQWGSVNPQAMTYISSLSEASVIEAAEAATGVHLECTSIAGNLVSDNFSIMIASGDYCDFIDNIGQQYTDGADAAIADGVLIDLAPYLEENAPDFWALLQGDDDTRRFATTDAGAIPFFLSITQDADALLDNGMLIRQDWLDSLGLESPETFDELHDVLTAFQTEMGATAALWLGSDGMTLSEYYGASVAYERMAPKYPFYVQDGVVYCGYLEDSYRGYLETMAQWYAEGLIWQDFMTDGMAFGITSSNGLTEFTNGNMGVAYGELTDIRDVPEMASDGMVLSAMRDPSVEPGDVNHRSSASSPLGYKWGISTSCGDVELACKYANYFYTEAGSLLATYGVEGEAYTLVDGEPVFTELVTNNPDGLSSMVIAALYMGTENIGLFDGNYKLQLYSEDLVAQAQVWKDSRVGDEVYPKGPSFTVDEAAEISSVFGDLTTMVSETSVQFITGERDIATEYDSFIESIVALGAENITAVFQAAYDRYMSR